ncbi:MAG: hypothetical protein DMF82_06430 [Acidobacteria bacterium]|nr:MAG: hypothetical protein DMF82_06430 [Acidobacteriota bacterium]
MVLGRAFARRRRAAILWMLAVYALLLAVNPVLHDDLACHLKSPTHCSACTASPSASRVEAMGPSLPAPVSLGSVEPMPSASETDTPLVVRAGRAPPA